jgi:hypothetical protein
MTLIWLVTGASLLIALVAFSQARRTAKRLEEISQHYWELKYQNGELRVQIEQLTGQSTKEKPAPAPTAAQARDSFVPLSSLKR